MSASQLPPLSQTSESFESDSEYLGTPVDPPSSRPHVADYEPHGDYYYHGAPYDSAEYIHGVQPAPFGPAATDSAYVAGSLQHSLLLDPTYPTLPAGCSPSVDNILPPARWNTASHSPPGSANVALQGTYPSRPARTTSGDVQISALSQSRRRGSSLEQYSPPSLPRPDWEGDEPDCGENAPYASTYSNPQFGHPDLPRATGASYTPSHPQSSYSGGDSSSTTSQANYSPQSWYDEGSVDSPVDDPAYGERFPDHGNAYELHAGYGSFAPYPQPQLDSHFPPHAHHDMRFQQQVGCTYPYGFVDGHHDAGFGVGPGALQYIHAPRPQQLHDLHGLHNRTSSRTDEAGRRPYTLTIPSVPAPPPIPRPSSLIEDSPKKPLTLACYFCRKRKIACQSPPAHAVDRTCNQCAKRKLKCVYPATSRRGIRPRMYDLTDESFRRPSDPLAL